MRDEEKILRVGLKRRRKELARNQIRPFLVRSYLRRKEEFDLRFRNFQPDFVKLTPPDNLSVLLNRHETINYFNRVSNRLMQSEYTHMDFSEVEQTDLPTICLIIAFMYDHRHPVRYLRVSVPGKSSPYKDIWEKVQFDSMVRNRTGFRAGSFLSRQSKTANEPILNEILSSTLEFFGQEKMPELRDLNSVINEIIENTTLHAHPTKTSKLPWLINTKTIIDGATKEKEYCIVDLGMGIYDSVQNNVKKWNTKRAKLKHRLSVALDDSSTQNDFLCKNIPKGIGSRTNDVRRGKGVRHVHEMSKNKIYDQFEVITNKAHINLKNLDEVREDIKDNFKGTIYYWKIKLYD